jgi:hypothetical protein
MVTGNNQRILFTFLTVERVVENMEICERNAFGAVLICIVRK